MHSRFGGWCLSSSSSESGEASPHLRSLITTITITTAVVIDQHRVSLSTGLSRSGRRGSCRSLGRGGEGRGGSDGNPCTHPTPFRSPGFDTDEHEWMDRGGEGARRVSSAPPRPFRHAIPSPVLRVRRASSVLTSCATGPAPHREHLPRGRGGRSREVWRAKPITNVIMDVCVCVRARTRTPVFPFLAFFSLAPVDRRDRHQRAAEKQGTRKRRHGRDRAGLFFDFYRRRL